MAITKSVKAIKTFLLISAIALLMHPLKLFLEKGSIVAKPCCEPGSASDASIFFLEFGPVSLVSGLVLLGCYFLFPIRKLKKAKDDIFGVVLLLAPLVIFGYMVFSTLQYRNEVAVYRTCSPLVWEQGSGFVDTDQQIACFEENGLKYTVLENKLKNLREARPQYHTDYFPYMP